MRIMLMCTYLYNKKHINLVFATNICGGKIYVTEIEIPVFEINK